MTPWVYEDTADPAAQWGRANGEDAVLLDMPDGADRSDLGVPGTDDWDGPSITFQGGKDLALAWLRAAIESVEALPDEPA